MFVIVCCDDILTVLCFELMITNHCFVYLDDQILSDDEEQCLLLLFFYMKIGKNELK